MMTKKVATKAFLAGYFSKVAQAGAIKHDPPHVLTNRVDIPKRLDMVERAWRRLNPGK